MSCASGSSTTSTGTRCSRAPAAMSCSAVRAAALVLDADLRGRLHAQCAELLLQRAPGALQEGAQIEVLRKLVELEQERMERAQRSALLVLVQLVVRVVDRIEVHDHQVR